MLCFMFGRSWLSGSENENMKVYVDSDDYDDDGQRVIRNAHSAFGSRELKIFSSRNDSPISTNRGTNTTNNL